VPQNVICYKEVKKIITGLVVAIKLTDKSTRGC